MNDYREAHIHILPSNLHRQSPNFPYESPYLRIILLSLASALSLLSCYRDTTPLDESQKQAYV